MGSGAESSIAPFSYYAPLLERLDYYMEMLDHDQDEEEGDSVSNDGEGSMEDSATRLRLFMVNLAARACSRLAYSEGDASESRRPKDDFESLIEMPASQWEDLSHDVKELRTKLQRGGEKTSPEFERLNCQMEAMGELAKLRSKLAAYHRAIYNEEDDGKRSASEYLLVRHDIEEYKKASHTIDRKLRDINQASHDGLFVSHQMFEEILALKKWTTIQSIRICLSSIIGCIDDTINEKDLPLQNFQVQLLTLLKDWEKSYLPTPVLFKAGYFKHGASSSSSRRAAAAAGASTPVSPTTPVASSQRHRNVANQKPPNKHGDGSSDESQVKFAIAADIQKRAKAQSLNLGLVRQIIEIDLDSGSDSDDDKPLSNLEKGSSPERRKIAKSRSSPASYRKKRSASTQTPSPRRQQNRLDDSDQDISLQSSRKKVHSPRIKRRRRTYWTDEEVDALRKGVQRFKEGNWRDIHDYYQKIWDVNQRTQVDLKDKYRNLNR